MLRRPPRSTRTDTLFPYTTLFRSRVIRLIAGFAALALPAGAMAQTVQAEADEPEFDGGCCSFWVPRIATEIIVVRGSGALQPADGDNVQGSSLIAYPEFGLGSRIENRLRDEAGFGPFRRSHGRSAPPPSTGVTHRGPGT